MHELASLHIFQLLVNGWILASQFRQACYTDLTLIYWPRHIDSRSMSHTLRWLLVEWIVIAINELLFWLGWLTLAILFGISHVVVWELFYNGLGGFNSFHDDYKRINKIKLIYSYHFIILARIILMFWTSSSIIDRSYLFYSWAPIIESLDCFSFGRILLN